jgi:hypothetical protein
LFTTVIVRSAETIVARVTSNAREDFILTNCKEKVDEPRKELPLVGLVVILS